MNELVILNNMLNMLEFEKVANSKDIINNIYTIIYILETEGVNVEVHRTRLDRIIKKY